MRNYSLQTNRICKHKMINKIVPVTTEKYQRLKDILAFRINFLSLDSNYL